METRSVTGTPFEPCTTPHPTSPTTSEFSKKSTEDNESTCSPKPEADTKHQLTGSPSSPPQSLAELTRSLNVYHLPEEILIDIFFLAINHASPGSPRERPLERTVKSSYRQLFILLGVCSDWRRICLTRGAFWSLVSARKHWSEPESVMNLCLERMQGSDMHLDGELSDATNSKLLEIINGYGSRIRTLNVSGENPEVLCTTVTSLLDHSKPGFLSNLLIRNDRNTLDNNSHHTWPFLFPPSSPEHTQLEEFTNSLNTLNLSGFRLDWGHTGFSRLVELQIQHICFDSLSEITDLLHTIASAPMLNRLQLVDLRCHLDDIQTLQIDPPGNLPAFHPSLQFVFLKNIRWSLLMLVLRSIIPGPYRVAISYTRRAYLRRYSTDLDILKESVLRNFNIDALMISRNWVNQSDFLRCLLKAMPTVKALSIAHSEFTKEVFQALTRPVESSSDDEKLSFPAIHKLHIMGSTFEPLALDGLKEVVTSHGTHELKIGGSIEELKSDSEHTPTLEHSVRFEDPKDDEQTAPMKGWLSDTVPKFSLVKGLDALPDFDLQCYDW